MKEIQDLSANTVAEGGVDRWGSVGRYSMNRIEHMYMGNENMTFKNNQKNLQK